MKTSRVVLAFGLILTMGLMSFSLGDQEKWVVPDNYKKMKNPTDPNDEDGLDVGLQMPDVAGAEQDHIHAGFMTRVTIGGVDDARCTGLFGEEGKRRLAIDR